MPPVNSSIFIYLPMLWVYCAVVNRGYGRVQSTLPKYVKIEWHGCGIFNFLVNREQKYSYLP